MRTATVSPRSTAEAHRRSWVGVVVGDHDPLSPLHLSHKVGRTTTRLRTAALAVPTSFSSSAVVQDIDGLDDRNEEHGMQARRSRRRLLSGALALLTMAGVTTAATERPALATLADGRIVSITAGGADGESFATGITEAEDTGADTVTLTLNWADIETSANTYVDPLTPDPNDASTQRVIDLYADELVPRGMKVLLNIRPIMGQCRVTPSDLASTAWNSTTMTNRFAALLDAIDGFMGSLQVAAVTVGTEVDSYLETTTEYGQWNTFISAANTKINSLWGTSVLMGSTATWHGLTVANASGGDKEQLQSMNAYTDEVMFTYYGVDLVNGVVKHPYTDVVNDINAVVNNTSIYASGTKFAIIEAGYPTASALSSSNVHQDYFVQTMFGLYDVYDDRITLINFEWLTDLTTYSAAWIGVGPWAGSGSCSGAPPAVPTGVNAYPSAATGTSTYKYYVVASNSSGPSNPSSVVTVSVGPSSLTSTNNIAIWWNSVSGAAEYQIVRLDSGPTGLRVGYIGETTNTWFYDTGLQVPDSSWYFQEYIRTLGYRTNTSPAVEKDAYAEMTYQIGLRD